MPPPKGTCLPCATRYIRFLARPAPLPIYLLGQNSQKLLQLFQKEQAEHAAHAEEVGSPCNDAFHYAPVPVLGLETLAALKPNNPPILVLMTPGAPSRPDWHAMVDRLIALRARITPDEAWQIVRLDHAMRHGHLQVVVLGGGGSPSELAAKLDEHADALIDLASRNDRAGFNSLSQALGIQESDWDEGWAYAKGAAKVKARQRSTMSGRLPGDPGEEQP